MTWQCSLSRFSRVTLVEIGDDVAVVELTAWVRGEQSYPGFNRWFRQMSRRHCLEMDRFSVAVLGNAPSSLCFSRMRCRDRHLSRCVLRPGSHPAMPSLAARFTGSAADSLWRRTTAPTSYFSGGNHPSPTAHPCHTTTALAQLSTKFVLSRAVVADVTLPRSGLDIMFSEDGAGRLIFRFSSWDFVPSSSLVLTRRSL